MGDFDIANKIKTDLNLVDSDDWKTRQITSIMVIIFFAMVSISYILFFNSFINIENGKEKTTNDGDSILDNTNFKRLMIFITSISSLIIIVIMSSNSERIDSDTSTGIIWALIGLNAIIYIKMILNISLKDFKENPIIKYIINLLFSEKILFDEPFITYAYPFIIELFVIISYLTSSNLLKSFIFGIVSAFLIFDFLIEERYYPLINIVFVENVKDDKNNFIYRCIFMIFYFLLLISVLFLSFFYLS